MQVNGYTDPSYALCLGICGGNELGEGRFLFHTVQHISGMKCDMCIGGSAVVVIDFLLKLIEERFHAGIITLVKDGEKFVAAVSAEEAVR